MTKCLIDNFWAFWKRDCRSRLTKNGPLPTTRVFHCSNFATQDWPLNFYHIVNKQVFEANTQYILFIWWCSCIDTCLMQLIYSAHLCCMFNASKLKLCFNAPKPSCYVKPIIFSAQIKLLSCLFRLRQSLLTVKKYLFIKITIKKSL